MREGWEIGEGAGEVEVHETVRVSETKRGKWDGLEGADREEHAGNSV